MGHSLWKASEVDSDQTLHMYIVEHDPFGPAKVVVGVSIAQIRSDTHSVQRDTG